MTERKLDSIEPPSSGRDEYRDTEVRGLVLRVTATGAQSWTYQYRHEGGNQRVTIGSYPAIDLKTARSRGSVIAGQVAGGKNPAAAKQAERANRKTDKVGELIDQFVRLSVKPNTRDWLNTQRNLKAHVGSLYGSKVANTLSMSDVMVVTDGLMERGTPHAANHVRYAVQSMFRWSAGRGLVDAGHELCDIPRPFRFNPMRQGRKRVLDDDEIKTFWHALDAMASQPNRSWVSAAKAYRILLLTGQRKNEIAGSLWSWWKFDHADGPFLDLPETATKNARRHVVPLSPFVVDVVGSPDQRGGYVFTSDGGKTHLALGSKHKNWLNQYALLSPWVVHDLRRTMATGMRRLGVVSDVVAHVLNHREASIRDVYDLYDKLPERREAMGRWSNFVQRLVAP